MLAQAIVALMKRISLYSKYLKQRFKFLCCQVNLPQEDDDQVENFGLELNRDHKLTIKHSLMDIAYKQKVLKLYQSSEGRATKTG